MGLSEQGYGSYMVHAWCTLRLCALLPWYAGWVYIAVNDSHGYSMSLVCSWNELGMSYVPVSSSPFCTRPFWRIPILMPNWPVRRGGRGGFEGGVRGACLPGTRWGQKNSLSSVLKPCSPQPCSARLQSLSISGKWQLQIAGMSGKTLGSTLEREVLRKSCRNWWAVIHLGDWFLYGWRKKDLTGTEKRPNRYAKKT